MSAHVSPRKMIAVPEDTHAALHTLARLKGRPATVTLSILVAKELLALADDAAALWLKDVPVPAIAADLGLDPAAEDDLLDLILVSDAVKRTARGERA